MQISVNYFMVQSLKVYIVDKWSQVLGFGVICEMNDS